jgi:hypothetical protein
MGVNTGAGGADGESETPGLETTGELAGATIGSCVEPSPGVVGVTIGVCGEVVGAVLPAEPPPQPANAKESAVTSATFLSVKFFIFRLRLLIQYVYYTLFYRKVNQNL